MMTLFEHVDVVAPPWTLSGTGTILLYRFRKDFLQRHGFISPALLPHFLGGLSVVMLVDYGRSEAGPYQELLFIPGMFKINGRRTYSISKIYVSTAVSVVSGWHNWGIPKELASFDFSKREAGRQRVTIEAEAGAVATFDLQPKGPKLPFTTAIVPAGLRTLYHQFEGQAFWTTPSGNGRLQPVKRLDAKTVSTRFPDLSQGKLLAAVQATGFQLRFPIAKVEALL